jgi:hypothetical protein
VGFTALSFARPDPSNFTFTPPPGAKVRTARLPAGPGPFAGPRHMAGLGRAGLPHQRLRLRGHPSGMRCHPLSHRCLIVLPGGRRMAGPVLCKPQGPQIHQVPKGCLPLKELARRAGLTPAQFRKLISGGRGAPPFGVVPPEQLRGCQSGWTAYAPETGQVNPGSCTRQRFGSSWTTVVVFPAAVGQRAVSPFGLLLRAAKPVHGSWGSGRLLTTSLLSVLVTSDGTVLAGAVTPDTLYTDAAQLTAQHA